MSSMETAVGGRTVDDRAVRPGGNVARPFMASFIDHLVKNGIVTADVAQKAVALKQQNPADRRSVTDILQEEFRVPRDILQFQIAQFYAFRIVDANDRANRKMTNAEATKLFKGLSDSVRAIAIRHKIFPFDIPDNQQDKLIIVTPNPSDREVTEVARAFPYKKFEICYMKEREWDEFYRIATSDKTPAKPAPVITDVVPEVDESELDAVLDREMTRAQIGTLIEKVLTDAIKANATAIHIVPKSARKTEIYFRADGGLTLWLTIDDVRAEAVAAYVKARTPGMDRYERLAAQEGNISKLADGRPVHLLVSCVPVSVREQGGKFELITVRINREPEEFSTTVGLGMSAASVQAFRDAAALRRGVMLFTGPSGSGRRTTVATLVRLLATPGTSAVAIDVGSAWMIEGVNHLRLTPKLNLERSLDILERTDADVLLLGDLTTKEAATKVLQLALDGRQIFATMLARDTAGAILWLERMGVDPYLIAHGLVLVHAQRLVRRLCAHCKTPTTVEPVQLTRLGMSIPATSVYRNVGCPECSNGYHGRVPIHETLPMTPSVREIITQGGDQWLERLRAAIRTTGGATLLDAGADLVKSGLTTLDELWPALS
jgi:type II secretory ATPase GspE/PulE/Tfp pilus assembly ATPase PilB-like protein